MNEFITNANKSELRSNAVSSKITTTPARITAADCQHMSDQELLQMLLKASKHTKDFQDYMGCDFPHSYLVEVIKSRGFEQGWHKPDHGIETIIVKKSAEKCVRQTLNIEKSVADDWKKFSASIPNKNVILQAALERFMSDYRSGRIKFELQI
jgi:hypothetical protein